MAQTGAGSTVPVPYSHSRRWKLIANSGWNVVLLLVTLAVFSMASATGGAGGRLLSALIPDVLVVALPGIPLALLMASGELDLSLAAMIGLSAIIAATTISDGGSLIGAIGVCMGLGLVVGLVHAALVGAARLNGALVTFASGALLAAAALVLSGGTTVMARTSDAEVSLVYMLGWGMVLVMLLAGIGLTYFSPSGQRPVHSDPPEPRLRRTLMVGLPYVAGGMLAGLAGVVLLGRLQAAVPSIASTYQLRLLLAVVIGGTPFGRGVSSAFGALLGAVFVAALSMMLQLMGIEITLNSFIFGMVLVAAVVLVHGYHALFGWMASRRAAPAPAPEPPPAEKNDAASAS